LYGAGLERIVQIIGAERGAEICADPLVESLLLVHDLHPLDTVTRVRRALDTVRSVPGSAAGDVAYRGIADDGVVRVLLIRGGRGCGLAAVREAIETAVREAAPEVTGVEVEVATEPVPLPLLRIGRRPGMAA
jgi:Fe-S cluster biogenesis protein NfuA